MPKKTDVVTFVVPGKPVPKVRMTQRSKFSKQAKRCLEYQGRVETCAWLAGQNFGIPEPPVAITLLFSFADRVRRDPDNLAKSVLDGLQPAIIPDDSTKIVRHLVISVDHVDPGDEQVEVTIIPLDEPDGADGFAAAVPLRPEATKNLPENVRAAIERAEKGGPRK